MMFGVKRGYNLINGVKSYLRLSSMSPFSQVAEQPHSVVEMAFDYFGSEGGYCKDPQPPVIFLHGTMTSRKAWNPIAKIVAEKTKREVYTLDTRNHGESAHSTDTSYAAATGDLVHFITSRNFTKVSLIGHSTGGGIAICAALTQPEVVKDLIVLEFTANEDHLRESYKSLIPPYANNLLAVQFPECGTIEEARESVFQQLKGCMKDDALKSFLKIEVKKYPDGRFGWQSNLHTIISMFHKLVQLELRPGKDMFDGPTTFIGKENSQYLRREDHSIIARLFPKAKFHYIEKVGHSPHISKPEKVLDLILTNLET